MEPFDPVLEQVKKARNVAELRALREQVHEEFLRCVAYTDPFDWSRRVNAFHDAVAVRAIEWSEQELLAEGRGAPPLPYAFLFYGSGGRGEQTLWSDQDNALVYADPTSASERLAAEAYFRELAFRICSHLQSAGYPPCAGGVLCTNERWLKPVTAYKEMLREWLSVPDWEHIRYLLIAADVRTVYGDKALGTAVMDVLYDYVAASPGILQHLLTNTLHHKVSIGMFGQLIKERYGEDAGGVDIKYGAYIPIVNGVRLLAMKAGIRCTSTAGRLKKLISGKAVGEEIGDDFLEAFAIALKLRSMTPYQVQDGFYTTRGKLSAELLTRDRMTELKLCLRVGTDLQKYVKKTVQQEI